MIWSSDRLTRAKNYFFADHHICRSEYVCFGRRSTHLVPIVFSVIFNSCYVWTLDQQLKQMMDVVENKFLTMMFSHKRRTLKSGELEKWVSYHRRHVNIVRNLARKSNHGFPFERYRVCICRFDFRTFACSSNLCVERLRSAITWKIVSGG